MDAVVYTTNTGYTRQYAVLAGKITGIPVYSVKEAENKLKKSSEIIYFGWIMADKVKGYKKASKKYKIRAVCAVGMSATGSRTEAIGKANNIDHKFPLFTLQGGFDIKKLNGIYKIMINMFIKTAGKKLSEKKDRTADEELMLDLMNKGGSRVSVNNMSEFFSWYDKQSKIKK
ncbi:MAG: hypothetical protein Q4F95_00120 [Oscillospiraceae bacterium]|nr:hypothetical protein [Oscillospiraceae bacterium]